MSDEPKTFCKAPFKTAVIDTGGELLPCCEFMTNESALAPSKLNYADDWQFNQWWEKGLDPLREKMLKGEVDPGCRYCISKEKNAGVSSLRIGTNKYISDTFEEIKNDYLQKKREYPKQVELRLGNYCNLKCIMCGPYASSSIMTEYKKHKKEYNEFGIESNWGDPNMPKDWYTYEHNKETLMDVASKAIRINFGGGEPFISPVIVEVLEAISPNTHLRFNTNMTRINDKVLEALKKFDSIEIEASIDGVGAHNEYYRSGSRWDLIVENFKKLKSYDNIKLNIGYVLQHTSLYTLKDVMAFVNDMDLTIAFGEVYYGSVDGSGHLTINSALEKDIDNFKKWLDSSNSISQTQKNTIQMWLDSYESNAILHTRFKKYVKMLDSFRGTDFAKTFNPSWT
jgi:organic radical activating enzyme|tara:strand:+ start:89 stop:1279 length:1191 start_codon:yes stop_codon:yes gene_type:complete